MQVWHREEVADDADELLPADDGDVVDAMVADELADAGHRIAVVNGDDVGAHDFGYGFVAFHIADALCAAEFILPRRRLAERPRRYN